MALSLSFAARSDVGQERDENQDAYGFAESDALWVFTVCDGLGGYSGGATASRMAVAALETRIPDGEGPLPERMERAIQRANRLIHEKAQSDRTFHKMATTVALFVVDAAAGEAHIAHVGDSRIYQMRGDAFTQLTRDHTFVQRLVDDGILTEEAAAKHPQSNVISRSVGGDPEVNVELAEEPVTLQLGDVYVLCSDGLHGLVSDEEVARTVLEHEPKEAARILVDRANEEGGHDNITVQIVAVEPRAEGVPDVIRVVKPAPLRRVAPAAPGRARAEAPGGGDLALADTDPRQPAVSKDELENAAAPAPPTPADVPSASADPALSETTPSALADDDKGVSGAFVLGALLAVIVVAAVAIALMLWSTDNPNVQVLEAPAGAEASGEASEEASAEASGDGSAREAAP